MASVSLAPQEEERPPMADLSSLHEKVTCLDRDHPLRAMVGCLPRRMPAEEFVAILPTLWALAEASP